MVLSPKQEFGHIYCKPLKKIALCHIREHRTEKQKFKIHFGIQSVCNRSKFADLWNEERPGRYRRTLGLANFRKLSV
jgi:hypothetical protein